MPAALAAPLLERLREQRHHQQLERLEALQALLGTGWWEVLSDSDEVQLAPTLAAQPAAWTTTRLPLEDWLSSLHPADRDELRSRLQALQQRRQAAGLVRAPATPTAINRCRCGIACKARSLGSGEQRRLVGFMLDISDIKNQQQQAAAAHARLDNLIASSPAVIYVQRYVEGALQPTFFSASLQPLLGWSLADCGDGALVEHVHPEDRDRAISNAPANCCAKARCARAIACATSQGDYHWLLDEAKLLRDDLGLPVEAVGLWLDVTEATLAAEQVKTERRALPDSGGRFAGDDLPLPPGPDPDLRQPAAGDVSGMHAGAIAGGQSGQLDVRRTARGVRPAPRRN